MLKCPHLGPVILPCRWAGVKACSLRSSGPCTCSWREQSACAISQAHHHLPLLIERECCCLDRLAVFQNCNAFCWHLYLIQPLHSQRVDGLPPCLSSQFKSAIPAFHTMELYFVPVPGRIWLGTSE